MKTEIDSGEYDPPMPPLFGHSLPQDPMEMYQRPQQQPDVPPFYLQNFHQAQWINNQQKRFPAPMPQQNFQPEQPPVHFQNQAPNVVVSNRPYMHPQIRAMHMQQQQEQQRRHQQMLQQQNMMRMQNHMMHRQQLRMQHQINPQQAIRIPIQQHANQQWRFHHIRSAVPILNTSPAPTPPPLLPVECQLAETPAPDPNDRAMDDFNDFDVTDLLRLSFGDEHEQFSRKRRASSKSSCDEYPAKRYRRRKAELIAERNEKLLEQCKDVAIYLERLNLPERVRIFGKNILRENLPNVPTMKLTPKNIDFTRIRNIGYLVTKKGICFSCLTECKFKSYDVEKFKEHLNAYHHVEGCGSTEGYCRACERHCCGYSPVDEVYHVLTKHVPSVERHPMHQILHSHIKKPARQDEIDLTACIEENLGSILDNIEDLENTLDEKFLSKTSSRKSKKRRRNLISSYSDDEDFNPEREQEEDDEDIPSDCEEILGDTTENESEAEFSSEEFIKLSDEEPVFDSDSDSEKSKSEWEIVGRKNPEKSDDSSKTSSNDQSQSAMDEFDEVPLYMLNRIKIHASTKSLNEDHDESIKSNHSVKEVLKDILRDENLLNSPEENKKKKKSSFARKRTFTTISPNKSFIVDKARDLPPCRVVLKRLEDTSDSELNDVTHKRSITEIKLNKSIEVPINIPTPPASENSRDSLPSPPLNKTANRSDKAIESDSISSENVINEEISKSTIETDKAESVHSIDTCSDVVEILVKEVNLELSQKNLERTPEKPLRMRTRNSKSAEVEEVSFEDKENSSKKLVNDIQTESPKCVKTPRKAAAAKFLKRRRFLRKFHKIDKFLKKSKAVNEASKAEQVQDEIIEIQDSQEILPETDTTAIGSEIIEIQESPKKVLDGVTELPSTGENISEDLVSPHIAPEAYEESPTIDSEIIEIQESPQYVSNSVTETTSMTQESQELPPDPAKAAVCKNLSLVIHEVESVATSGKNKLSNTEDLISLEELYPWINSNTAGSIFKSRKSFKILQQENAQFSTFKCMKQNCSYFTIHLEKFKDHVSLHSGVQYCSFCLHKSVNGTDLMVHIFKNHRYDRYQCNLCMYRSAEKVYVEWHQKRHHDPPSGIVLRSSTQVTMKSLRTKVEELKDEERKKFVLPYKCKTSTCTKQFFSKVNFLAHLKEESSSDDLTPFADDIARQLLQLDQTRMKTYKEGYNQCLYCEYGSDQITDLHCHLADNHANTLGYICRRVTENEAISEESNNNETETIEKQTRIEYIGGSSYKIKLFTGSLEELTAQDEVIEDQTENTNEIIAGTSLEIQKSDQISNSSVVEPPTIPVISEIVHVDNF